jgi:sterol 3beta-glucosyltransferase
LQRNGHQVQLAAPPRFEPLARRAGITLAPVAADIRDVIGTALGQPPVGPTLAYLRFMSHAHRSIRRVFGASLDPWWAACQDAEAVVFAATAPAGYDIARRLGVPCAQVAVQPIAPTRAFASPGVPPLPLGGTYNRLTYHAAQLGGWRLLSQPINRWRRTTLGLPPWGWDGPYAEQRRMTVPVLQAYSPAVVPRPDDWGPEVHVTGYWFDDDEAYDPPPELVRFLGVGEPPVYVGFGSMAGPDPQGMTRMIVRALRRAGRRGLLLTGWGGLVRGDWGDDILVVDEVSHRWLLPQVAAVVHHAGAGTTAAVLRAGVPSIAVPFLSADQRFWGDRVAALGAGHRPLSRGGLTASRLAAAIGSVTHDTVMRRRAEALGQQISGEDGVSTAVNILERAFS